MEAQTCLNEVSLRGLLLIETMRLVLNSAMSGLATGYVIPKLKVSDLVTPVAHGRPGGEALGVALSVNSSAVDY